MKAGETITRWDPFEGEIVLPAGPADLPPPVRRMSYPVAQPEFMLAAGFSTIGFSLIFYGKGQIVSSVLIGLVGFMVSILALTRILLARGRAKRDAAEQSLDIDAPSIARLFTLTANREGWSARPGFGSLRIARLCAFAPEIGPFAPRQSAGLRPDDMAVELWGEGADGRAFWLAATEGGWRTVRRRTETGGFSELYQEGAFRVVTALAIERRSGMRIALKPECHRPADDIDLDSVEFNDLFTVRLGSSGKIAPADGSEADLRLEVFRTLSPAVLSRLVDLGESAGTTVIIDDGVMIAATILPRREDAKAVAREIYDFVELIGAIGSLLRASSPQKKRSYHQDE
ncbi:hypothetical protein [Fulvimarina sp. MAC8]|uniref:hypothetical protein n=1 Tax=Fulvimarina sp. MAC8 TaxID=3162874 RepID=UPI0032ECD188